MVELHLGLAATLSVPGTGRGALSWRRGPGSIVVRCWVGSRDGGAAGHGAAADHCRVRLDGGRTSSPPASPRRLRMCCCGSGSGGPIRTLPARTTPTTGRRGSRACVVALAHGLELMGQRSTGGVTRPGWCRVWRLFVPTGSAAVLSAQVRAGPASSSPCRPATTPPVAASSPGQCSPSMGQTRASWGRAWDRKLWFCNGCSGSCSVLSSPKIGSALFD